MQGRGLPVKTDKVPLGYKTTVEGTFTISIDKVDGVLSSRTVFVEDKVANVIHNLKHSAYSFSTLKGVYDDRFVLRYMDNSVVTTPVVRDPVVLVPNKARRTRLGSDGFHNNGRTIVVSVKNRQIKINSFDETIRTVMVYDLNGRLLYQKEDVNTYEFNIADKELAKQIVIVITVLSNGTRQSNEIIF
jgi:hypothetical protein